MSKGRKAKSAVNREPLVRHVLSRRSCLAVLLAGASATACSADAADEPLPLITTPGAFVAYQGDDSRRLIRILRVVIIGGEEVIFAILYAPHPRDFGHARELAMQQSLDVESDLVLIASSYLIGRRWEVVWYRSLTEDEQEVL